VSSPDKPIQDFQRVACAYELLVNENRRWTGERPALQRWLEQAGERRRRVIDLGCGTGFHARHLAGHLDATVTAADPAQYMLDAGRAKPHGDRVRWIRASAEQPPPGPFDLALLLGNTLSLIRTPPDVLHAVSGIVAPAGLFVIQMLDYDKLRRSGGEHRTASGEGLSIEKRLTPGKEGSDIGATLHITIRNESGTILARQDSTLWDHDLQAIIREAGNLGWRVIERRSSYENETEGNDRIAVLELEGRR
jgi:SAM-dependent methyltransferase